MRILFVSSLCSTPLLPHGSPGNARIMRAMRALTPCRMIIPVHYYPRVLGRWSPKIRKAAGVPSVEIDPEGTELLHPRGGGEGVVAPGGWAGGARVSGGGEGRPRAGRARPPVVREGAELSSRRPAASSIAEDGSTAAGRRWCPARRARSAGRQAGT